MPEAGVGVTMSSARFRGIDMELEDVGKGRLRELDGWRAISVLLVITSHIGPHQYAGILSHFPGLASVVLQFGPLGVRTFFVISGFVICRLLISEELRYGSVSLKAFYYRRAFRILPPLYIYLGVLSLLLYFGLIHEHWRAILGGALFLYDVDLMPKSWLVGHTWSLAVEEQFYLIFPTMWVLTPKRFRSRVFLAVFFLCTAWSLYMLHTGWNLVISSRTRAGFACVACGVLMAIHEKRARMAANGIPAVIVVLIALILLLNPVGFNHWHVTVMYESLFVPLAIGLVLLYSLERGPRLRAFLCSKPVQAVGLTSYGIYLWQEPFTGPLTGNFPNSSRIIPLFLLCIIVPLSYFLIEKPAMRYGKFLSQRARKRSIRATAIV